MQYYIQQIYTQISINQNGDKPNYNQLRTHAHKYTQINQQQHNLKKKTENKV